MEFKKEDLQLMVYEDHDGEVFEVIEDEIIDTSRWSIIHRMVFKLDGKFYESSYLKGATEQQDEQPYEYDEDVIECDEVFPVEKTITVYEREKK